MDIAGNDDDDGDINSLSTTSSKKEQEKDVIKSPGPSKKSSIKLTAKWISTAMKKPT